tara:strand:+ start:225 stop:1046 length:822 start_codon:yes stop_codon:yes gene_type:complete
MKKLLFTLFLSFVLYLTFNSISFSATQKEKIQEIEQKFESGFFSKDECIKFKKIILGKDSEVYCGRSETKSLAIEYSHAVSDPVTVMDHVKELGTFAEPSRYPEDMFKLFGVCKSFHCRAKKATGEMSKTFGRGKKYHQRHPGAQLYAMAMFELFYLQELKKKQKKVEKFIAGWPNKRRYGRIVVSLIKLNKARKVMRKSLGMNLNTSVEEVMERYWLMADFLEQGKINKKKVNKDIKKRGVLLAEYKKAVGDFNSSIKKQEDEELYDKIEKK